MTSEPEDSREFERSNEPASEEIDAEKRDLDYVKETRKKRNSEIGIEMVSKNPDQKNKQRKACDDDPYIVKLIKGLINPDDQKSSTEKKK